MALVVKRTFLEFECSEYDLDVKSHCEAIPLGRASSLPLNFSFPRDAHSDDETDFPDTESESGWSGRSNSDDWESPGSTLTLSDAHKAIEALETDSAAFDEVEFGDIKFCSTKTNESMTFDEVETGDIEFCSTKTASSDDVAQEIVSPPRVVLLPCHAFNQSSASLSQGCPTPMGFMVSSPVFMGHVERGEAGLWAWTNVTSPTSFCMSPVSQIFPQQQGTPKAQSTPDAQPIQRELASSVQTVASEPSPKAQSSPVELSPKTHSAPDQQKESVQSPASKEKGKSSPKKLNSLPAEYYDSSFSTSIKEEDWTTVMVRNIPNNYTREMLLDLLDSEGLAGHYDFVYLPVDFKRDSSLGYAFVNLISGQSVKLIRKRLEGFTNWALPTEKVCEICWSRPLQGLQANLDRYRDSPVMHKDVSEKYKPLYFVDGKQVPMPPPTKKLRAPRVKLSVSESCKVAEA